MADAAVSQEDEAPKSSKLPLIIGFVLMVLGGGGGFYAVSSGLILAADSTDKEMVAQENLPKSDLENVSFVVIEPFSVSLSPDSPYKHLRFSAELEVEKSYKSEVETVMPRIVNVLNGYLRAVEASDLAQPTSLSRFRNQLLRRAQIVAGPGRINDLLIMEFVLN